MLKQAQKWMAIAACAGLAAAAVTAYSPDAEACGGLFCNQSQPVNQAAERIIFSKNPDNTVTAVVQIMYQGPSEQFAWVLPVPGAPEVDVSSAVALDRLQQATNPNYQLNTTIEGDCAGSFGGGFASADSSGAESGNNGGRGTGGVEVVSSGSVGPYNHTTISVDPSTPNPEEAALDWLDTNGYDITALAPDLIRDYLDDGMNLLAVKLQKNSETGDIRPIRITYDSELPMIPIKLTAVAANDDMGVLVWVLGQERAIPSNYKSLELNQAAINWFNPNQNYNDVISMAANEAQGQGFVTEYADSVAEPIQGQFGQQTDLTQNIFNSSEAAQWDNIASADWSNQEGDLLQRTSRYSQWDGYERVIEDHVPLPSNVTAQEFAQCPGCYDIIRQNDIEAFDPVTFIDQMDQLVIEPMAKTQELLNSLPYITRLYTTMSAAEMTLDPVFDFNADLGDESNRHVADQIIECSRDYTQSEAPWRIELPQGDTVYGVGRSWPVDPAEDDMPATRLIVQQETMGSGQVVEDNSAEINDAVERSNQRVTDEISGGLACSATGNSAVDLSLALVMAGFGLVAVRRRRS